MKIIALLVLKSTGDGSESVFLANASDASHLGSESEFIVFVGRTVANSTPPGQRQSVHHEEYKVHAYNRNGLCAVGFTDDHYPVRSAFSLLNEVLDEYRISFGESWRSIEADSTQIPWPYLDEALMKFQDPAEADKLLKIQEELDEPKIILHKTIDSVLAPGQSLDSLVEKTSDLSLASQMDTPTPVGAPAGLQRMVPARSAGGRRCRSVRRQVPEVSTSVIAADSGDTASDVTSGHGSASSDIVLTLSAGKLLIKNLKNYQKQLEHAAAHDPSSTMMVVVGRGLTDPQYEKVDAEINKMNTKLGRKALEIENTRVATSIRGLDRAVLGGIRSAEMRGWGDKSILDKPI